MDSLRKKRVGFPISHIFSVINSNIFPFSFPLTVEAITIRIFHRQNICDSSLPLLSRAVSSFLREKCGKASISRRRYLGKSQEKLFKVQFETRLWLISEPKVAGGQKKELCFKKRTPK